jgi:hypothetical protein
VPVLLLEPTLSWLRYVGGKRPTKAERKANLANLLELSRLVSAASESTPSNHELQCDDYDTVIATSDFHSDFSKTVQLMNSAGLIRLPHRDATSLRVAGIQSLDPYIDRYDVRLITETEWVQERTLFVICGDLVDGLRPISDGLDYDVDDEEGTFELRLHCFLFNMRLRAAEKGSAVLFTIGNHDLHTVIRNDGALNRYVSPSAVSFFGRAFREDDEHSEGAFQLRSETLRPFYACSPYLILSLCSRTGIPEVVFVHGGLRDNKESLFDEVRDAQLRVDAAVPSVRLALISANYDERGDKEAQVPRHVTWLRDYAMQDRCMYNVEMRQKGCELIVVGHCPTSGVADLVSTQCEGVNGCLLIACDEEHESQRSPLIALVDTAMSSCFHSSAADARKRPTQMLQLRKISTKTDNRPRARTSTYDISRLDVGPYRPFDIQERQQLQRILTVGPASPEHVFQRLEAFFKAHEEVDYFEKHARRNIIEGTGENMGRFEPDASMLAYFLRPENHEKMDPDRDGEGEDSAYVVACGEVITTILGLSKDTLNILSTISQTGILSYISKMSQHGHHVEKNNRTYQKILLTAARIISFNYPQIVVIDKTDDTTGDYDGNPRIEFGFNLERNGAIGKVEKDANYHCEYFFDTFNRNFSAMQLPFEKFVWGLDVSSISWLRKKTTAS